MHEIVFILVLFVNWYPINSSPLASLTRQQSSDYQGLFWQITDIHWDQQYSVDGNENKMCHKKYSKTNPMENEDTGVYGNYLCDSPWPLVKSALQTMTEIQGNPDFILWTGDNVPHVSDPEPDFETIYRTVNNITVELRTAFKESIPILPVLGNHDAFPKDNFPIAGEEFYGQYLTKGGWSLVLPEDAQADFKKGGYYLYSLPNLSKVSIMVLNTNLYYAPNTLLRNDSDPCGQFAWMREKFYQAQKNKEKIIVAAHAPPGYFERWAEFPFFSPLYSDVYVDLLNEFGDRIMAQIYGHEHTDSFKLFTTKKGNVKSVGFLAPSVTPWYPAPVPGGTPVNPSLRLYSYSSNTLLDYTQYHLNLSKIHHESNNHFIEEENLTSVDESSIKSEPKWETFYQATKIYGLDSLDIKNMYKLIGKLIANDTLFQKYYLMNSAGYNHGRCDGHCKRQQLCAIANIRTEELQECMNHTGESMHFIKTYLKLTHPKYNGHNYIIENEMSENGNGSKISDFIIVALTLGMALLVILTASLGILLVNIVLRRYRLLREDGSGGGGGIQVSDLNFGRRSKGYSPF